MAAMAVLLTATARADAVEGGQGHKGEGVPMA
jgi:hypothetical protein